MIANLRQMSYFVRMPYFEKMRNILLAKDKSSLMALVSAVGYEVLSPIHIVGMHFVLHENIENVFLSMCSCVQLYTPLKMKKYQVSMCNYCVVSSNL